MSTQGAVPTSHRARRRYFRYVTAGARRNVVASQRGLSAVLTNCDTRTRLTQREFVIASGHHSRSRTTAPKSLILGPRREIRSKSVSNGEPLFSVSRTSTGWRLTQPRRHVPCSSGTFRAELRAVAPIRARLLPFSICSHTDRGTGGHPQCPAVAPEDTDFELSRGEKGRERVNTGPRHAAALTFEGLQTGILNAARFIAGCGTAATRGAVGTGSS